ncbi:glycosyltransferase family 2 protein [Dysgonomonas termitidis]|uniref:Glycosyltransferase family 2 protein n=1 Tax=Dysgonomonas termitidis TaxID=1516126 RepID=A0ABV9KTD8_9BACT
MKLSIITINFNNAAGLQKTIESIVCQRNAGFEYIVIDGSSTDSSVDIIKKQADRITYWVSEPDTGIYNAMNKGIRKATGEYLLFVNSGDTIMGNTDLSSIIEKLASGEDIIYYNLEIAETNGNAYIKTYPDNPDFKYFAEDTLPHTASFIKRKRLIDYGYYSEEKKIASDWAFFIDAICSLNCKYKHINQCFSTFYIDGISSDFQNRKLLEKERDMHIALTYPLYNTIYKDWMEKKQELYKLKKSVSVQFLKKIGLLKWLKL